MNIVLASESASRKELLTKAGIPFDAVSSNFAEDLTLPVSPDKLTVLLSQGKARSVAEKYKDTDTIIIGADTVAVFEYHVLGKPHTEENAIKMLTMLSGNMHSMYTGLTMINTKTSEEISRSVETKIWFRKLSPEEIVAYAKSGEGLDKAAGYAYQAGGRSFVEKIEGSESSIMGLPIEEVQGLIKELSAI